MPNAVDKLSGTVSFRNQYTLNDDLWQELTMRATSEQFLYGGLDILVIKGVSRRRRQVFRAYWGLGILSGIPWYKLWLYNTERRHKEAAPCARQSIEVRLTH